MKCPYCQSDQAYKQAVDGRLMWLCSRCQSHGFLKNLQWLHKHLTDLRKGV